MYPSDYRRDDSGTCSRCGADTEVIGPPGGCHCASKNEKTAKNSADRLAIEGDIVDDPNEMWDPMLAVITPERSSARQHFAEFIQKVKNKMNKTNGQSQMTDYECWLNAVIEQGPNPPSLDSWRLSELAPAKVESSRQRVTTSDAPFCGSCRIQMVIKTNRTTNEQFYGCPNYREKRCKSIPLNKGRVRSYYPNIALESDYEEYSRDIGDR